MRATLISGAVKESRVCSFEGGKAKTLHPHSLVSMVLYAKDIVETDFLSLPPDTSVLQAAKAMATRHQGFAVVTAPDKGARGNRDGVGRARESRRTSPRSRARPPRRDHDVRARVRRSERRDRPRRTAHGGRRDASGPRREERQGHGRHPRTDDPRSDARLHRLRQRADRAVPVAAILGPIHQRALGRYRFGSSKKSITRTPAFSFAACGTPAGMKYSSPGR